MKTRILKAVLPMLAFVMAITASFAFKPAADSSLANFPGHKRVGSNCINASVQCTDQNTGVICKDADDNTLYKYVSLTSCPTQLWMP